MPGVVLPDIRERSGRMAGSLRWHGHAGGGNHCADRLPQQAVPRTPEAIIRHPRQQAGPGVSPLTGDVEPVAHEVEPSRVRPVHALLGADLVPYHDVAAIADAPTAFDGAQAELQLLPAEEQGFIIV